MIVNLNDKRKPSSSDANFLRKMAARNGFAINSINSKEEELEAITKGLPAEMAEDIIQFIESKLQPVESESSSA